MNKPCPWPGCTTPIPATMFLCTPHWRELPLRDRNDITAALARLRRVRDRGEALVEASAVLEAEKHLRTVQQRVLRSVAPVLP